MNSKPIIILIGPSGVGKSSFIDRLLTEDPRVCDITTYTTRTPREGESEGNPYHFVTKEKFRELIAKKFFVEFAEVHGQLYGTPWDQIQAAWAAKKIVIMDVDVQGARHFQKEFPEALTIFLKPPSLDVLRQRIIKRGQLKDLEVRMKNAEKELTQAHEFSHVLINDEFEVAYLQFRKLIEKLLKNQ